MAYDLFTKRMKKSNYGSDARYDYTLAKKTVDSSNIIMNTTFQNDPNYRHGMLYDNYMRPLQDCDFKIQKLNSHSSSLDTVDYRLQFRPGFNPEEYYRYKYQDNRARMGFYLDAPDPETGDVNKWLILEKDDRYSFDRYIIQKCNWDFEWLAKDRATGEYKYYHCLGVLRDSSNENYTTWRDDVVENIVQQIYFEVPTTLETNTIDYDMRFMFTDNKLHPKCFRVTKMSDTFPLGITKVILRQDMYNAHKDFIGTVEELKDMKYVLKGIGNIPDLNPYFGGKTHMICDMLVDGDQNQQIYKSKSPWTLNRVDTKLRIDGSPVMFRAVPSEGSGLVSADTLKWRVAIDGNDYVKSDLADYFEITMNDNNDCMTVKAINPIMAHYTLTIKIYDENTNLLDSQDIEVVN